MLLCGNLNPLPVQHDIAVGRVAHDAALNREKPCLINIIKLGTVCPDHDVDLAVMVIEFSHQSMGVNRSRQRASSVGEGLLPLRIDFQICCNRQRYGEIGFTRNTNFITDLPLDQSA